MRLDIDVSGSFAAILGDATQAGERSVSLAVSAAGRRVKDDWRSQIKAAGLGNRLANAVRNETYPKGKASLNAASLVWTKAPKITGAHESGPLIVSPNGFWLAIPLPSAGRSRSGGKISPAEWEQRTGRALRFVYRAGRSGLLVDDGTVLRGSRTMGRDGFSRSARGFKNRTVPIFALVPAVKLPKRLNLIGKAPAVVAGLPQQIVTGWK